MRTALRWKEDPGKRLLMAILSRKAYTTTVQNAPDEHEGSGGQTSNSSFGAESPSDSDGSNDQRSTFASKIVELEIHFERALRVMEMFYQPIVCASNYDHFGYEALLRSHEPTLPDPGAMLDAAEQLNRLPQLGRAIRHKVARIFCKQEKPQGCLFVNLHALDLLDSTLSSPYSPLAKIASQVVLEITERTSLNEVPQANRRICELRAMGYQIAIDDLGAGHSKMNQFAPVNTDFVKLDMSLIRDIDSHPFKQKLVSDINAHCHDNDIRVVGEGVETAEEAELLAALGCDFLQGFYFARPSRGFSD